MTEKMAKNKKSFFCCICGGPLTSWPLRKYTTVPPSEDESEFPLFKDWCNCGAEGYYGDAHTTSCPALRGYDGVLLPNKRIEWLQRTRMLCARAGSFSLWRYNEDPSPCFITDVGTLTPDAGFESSHFHTIWPIEDGFIFHDACWEILKMVYKTKFPYRETLCLPELWLSMRIRIEPSRRNVVDWGEGCSFGGTGEFQGSDWDARPGHEWLVADPTEDMEFRKITDASVATSSLGTAHQSNLLGAYRDPFFYLPVDIIHRIFECLPHGTRTDFMLVSRAARKASGSIWRTRLTKDLPWHHGTSLFQSLGERREFIRYGVLLKSLEEASSSSQDDNGLAGEQNWLGLKNRRRIWACCERIVDDLEKRFAAAREARGFVSEDVKAVSTFRISTVIEPKENEERCATDVYFCPTPTDAPGLQAITVYFLPDGTVIGIEILLDDEQLGRILGLRSICFQSVAVPSSVVINGFLLSLGPELPAIRDRPIKGVGILTDDSPLQPRFKFGTWTKRDVVQVFRPVAQRPEMEIINQKVVGITGQYNAERFLTFGIIVAVHEPREDDPYKLDIYSRWVNDWPPTHRLFPRRGCSVRYDEPYIEPAIHPVQNMYVSLVGSRLISVQGYYPHRDQNPLGGLSFNFADGSTQLIGRAENDPSIQAEVKVTLNSEKEERVVGWYAAFGHATDGSPSNVHYVGFLTSLGRDLVLGNVNAIDSEMDAAMRAHGNFRIFGFQIGDAPPWIESFSAVFGSAEKSPEEL